MICASVYLLVFIRILLVRLAEKILLLQPLIFRGDYRVTSSNLVLPTIPNACVQHARSNLELKRLPNWA
jgi:hypothetical protein